MNEIGRYVIYCSDAYYPGADYYSDLETAKKEWENLKERRKTEDPRYLGTDCFAQVIELNKLGEGDEIQ